MFMEMLYIGLNIFSWTEKLVSIIFSLGNGGKVGSGGKGSSQPPQKSINSHQRVNKDAICLNNTSEYLIFNMSFKWVVYFSFV